MPVRSKWVHVTQCWPSRMDQNILLHKSVSKNVFWTVFPDIIWDLIWRNHSIKEDAIYGLNQYFCCLSLSQLKINLSWNTQWGWIGKHALFAMAEPFCLSKSVRIYSPPAFVTRFPGQPIRMQSTSFSLCQGRFWQCVWVCSCLFQSTFYWESGITGPF